MGKYNQRKHRDHNGNVCYTFSWEGGGGNHVYAHSKRGAIIAAKKLGAGTHNRHGDKYAKPDTDRVVLVPNEETFRSVTIEQLRKFDYGLYLMTI